MLLLLILLILVIVWLSKSQKYKSLKHLPSYPRLPLIGSAHYLLGGGIAIFKRLCEVTEICERTGLPFLMMIGDTPLISFSEPEEVKIVSYTFVEKPYFYNLTCDFLTEGLVTATGETWKKTIKKLASTFSSSQVDEYMPIYNKLARKLVKSFKLKANKKKPFDAADDIFELAFESICLIGMGDSELKVDEYYKAVLKILQLAVSRGSTFYYHLDWIYRLTPSYQEMKRNIEIASNITENVIKKRLLQKGLEKSDENTQPYNSYLDHLLQLHETDATFTFQQIQNEIHTISVAGYHTTASLIFFTLFYLGCNSQAQRRLLTEIKSVFGDDKPDVTKEALLRMEYCDAVVNEALRMMPAAPYITRLADKELDMGSCVIPKGSICGINIWALGRSKRLWGADADDFRPERWLDGSVTFTAMIPFSIGKRACIGKKYAVAFIKTAIIHCVRELQFSADDRDLVLNFELAMKPAGGHLMNVQLRQEEI